jgi:hypothetical protein
VQVSDGAAAAALPEPMKPNAALAPALSDPLYATFRAVTLVPLDVRSTLQNWLTLCPLLSVQVTVQPLIDSEPAVIRTSAWKPPDHWLVTE